MSSEGSFSSRPRKIFDGKEVKNMTYTKPELTLLGRAADAVQGMGKGGQKTDFPGTQTTSAYEADE
jgi:hypothetical protein